MLYILGACLVLSVAFTRRLFRCFSKLIDKAWCCVVMLRFHSEVIIQISLTYHCWNAESNGWSAVVIEPVVPWRVIFMAATSPTAILSAMRVSNSTALF